MSIYSASQSTEENAQNLRTEIDNYIDNENFNFSEEDPINIENLVDSLDALDYYLPDESDDEAQFSTMSASNGYLWRSGDILYYPMGAQLYNSKGKAGKSKMGHTAVLSNDEGYVIEANKFEGAALVFENPIQRTWNYADGIKQYKVTSKTGKSASGTDRSIAVKYGLRQVGKPYGLKTTLFSDNVWYCSKLTYRQWKHAGYDLQSGPLVYASSLGIPGLVSGQILVPLSIALDMNTRHVKSWGRTDDKRKGYAY